MCRQPPGSTRAATPFPSTTLFRSQPSSGTAREGERAALANGRRHGDPVRLAHDRRIVAIGDDQPGTRRQKGIAIERARVEPRRQCPEKTVAMIEILGPFCVPEQIGPRDLDLDDRDPALGIDRSEEHTSELQSLMRISYAVFCLKQKKRSN